MQVGFLDPQDERFLGTLAAIRADLEVAEGLVHRYLTEQTDAGLLAQEYDVEGGRMAGNFPQALSHPALVRAVHSHDLAVRRRGTGR